MKPIDLRTNLSLHQLLMIIADFRAREPLGNGVAFRGLAAARFGSTPADLASTEVTLEYRSLTAKISDGLELDYFRVSTMDGHRYCAVRFTLLFSLSRLSRPAANPGRHFVHGLNFKTCAIELLVLILVCGRVRF